jgi:hypothetical protein
MKSTDLMRITGAYFWLGSMAPGVICAPNAGNGSIRIRPPPDCCRVREMLSNKLCTRGQSGIIRFGDCEGKGHQPVLVKVPY